jgi:hypothetical protein
MQLADIPATGPVLAQFSYVIRGPQSMPHFGVIDAQAWPTAPVAAGSSFDDAVAAAKLIAAKMRYDGIHGLPINQAQGIVEAANGTYSIVPLGGFHRERTGPLFVDGMFFERTALSLQVVRTSKELVAVVGTDRVLDLRRTGAAFVQTTNPNPPARP